MGQGLLMNGVVAVAVGGLVLAQATAATAVTEELVRATMAVVDTEGIVERQEVMEEMGVLAPQEEMGGMGTPTAATEATSLGQVMQVTLMEEQGATEDTVLAEQGAMVGTWVGARITLEAMVVAVETGGRMVAQVVTVVKVGHCPLEGAEDAVVMEGTG